MSRLTDARDHLASIEVARAKALTDRLSAAVEAVQEGTTRVQIASELGISRARLEHMLAGSNEAQIVKECLGLKSGPQTDKQPNERNT